MEYNEILKLRKMLVEMQIPHEWRRVFDGYQIGYPTLEPGKRVCSVVEHEYSYGHGADTLEIMGLLTEKEAVADHVLGGLTADEVFRRIMQDYRKR